MRQSVSICLNPFHDTGATTALPFSCQAAQAASRFFASLGCEPTPLYKLTGMAKLLGLASIHIKDESGFLGLNAFKARGALWAITRVIARELGISEANLTLADLTDAAKKSQMHFVTATDGNHGAAVAYAAKLLGQKATIFMPAGASAARVNAILNQGASCIVTSLSYDDAVRQAANYAQIHHAILLQDTAWRGYDEIPGWIMQGYVTMLAEICVQLDGKLPTHVFLQVGVGSFAAALTSALMAEAMKSAQPAPTIICMEPMSAACLYKSLLMADGSTHAVDGEMLTMMAGLACGELSTLAWPVLRANVLASASCADSLSALGMRLLAEPIAGDPVIISGESGAIGMGLLYHLMRKNDEWPAKLGLGSQSRALLVSTEGATDPRNWQTVTGKEPPLHSASTY